MVEAEERRAPRRGDSRTPARRASPGSRTPSSWSSLRRQSAASARAAGFQFELQSVAGGSLQDLDTVARQIIDEARRRPELVGIYTGFRPGVPQLDAQVDRAKAQALGVPISDVFASLQIFLGSLYVNDFNAFGRVYRVQLQAEPSFRATPADIARLYVRRSQARTGPCRTETRPRWCR